MHTNFRLDIYIVLTTIYPNKSCCFFFGNAYGATLGRFLVDGFSLTVVGVSLFV